MTGTLVMAALAWLALGARPARAKGGGKGASAPDIPAPAPAPKAETTKAVTAASTEARQSQKDKAAKAAGLKNTILSDALLSSGGDAPGRTKTLLGQ